MTHISDADLMAYADGVLPRHLRPLVRQALLRDPELLEKLESYIITNRGLAAPFDRLPPIPDRLLRLLAEAKPKAAGDRWWLFSLRSIEPKWAEHWRLPAWSLAGLAALVVATLAWQLNTASPLRPQLADAGAQGLASSPQFQRALEASESNSSTHLASLKPTGTFLSKEQAWCRQYELTRADETRLAGIACRDRDGAWQVKAQAVLTAAPPASGYAPAGEDQAGAPSLESALGKLMQDVVLLPADEKRLLAGGWQRPR
jgi:surface antigen